TPWPEPVGETQEVLLVNDVQHLDHRPLDDLVLQRGDAKRPQPPVGLRHVRPARRPRPVAPATDPGVQIPKVRFEVLPVIPPRPPPPLTRRCSAASQVLRDHLISHDRASRAYRLSVPLATRPNFRTGGRGTSRFSRMETTYVPRFFDRAGSTTSSR